MREERTVYQVNVLGEKIESTRFGGCGCKSSADLRYLRESPAGERLAGGSGRGAVWLARLNGVQKVASSNLVAPTCKSLRGNELRKAFLMPIK